MTITHEVEGFFVNFFKLFATGCFFSLSLLAAPIFSADLAPNDAMISPHNRAVKHEGWSYKKIAVGSAVCTLCVISATISPTIGLCTSSAAAIFGAVYYFRNKGPILGEELCINSQDFTEILPPPPEFEMVTTLPPGEKVSLAPIPLHRSLSFKDLSIPLRDLQIKILNGAIEGISISTIGSLAKILAEKRTLNGIARV
jgi:hypothetical protein